MSDKLIFNEIHQLQLFKVSESEGKLLDQPVASSRDITDYMKKYYYNKLLATESFNLGQQELDAIRILAMTTTRIDEGLEVD